MPFIGHLPELFVVLLIALLVFGPKRMIEMGSSLGRAFRDFRDSVKDIPGMDRMTSMGGLLNDDEPRRTPFSTASQTVQSFSVEANDPPTPAAAPYTPPNPTPVVDAAAEPAQHADPAAGTGGAPES